MVDSNCVAFFQPSVEDDNSEIKFKKSFAKDSIKQGTTDSIGICSVNGAVRVAKANSIPWVIVLTDMFVCVVLHRKSFQWIDRRELVVTGGEIVVVLLPSEYYSEMCAAIF